MCEFTVIVQDNAVFTDAIYVKVTGDTVEVKDVLGNTRIFKNYQITEVDVNSERLVLAPSNSPK